MKVILNQDVEHLGEEGDVKEVSRGYARNFLIPKGLVFLFNKENAARIAGRKRRIDERKAEKRKAALSTKERLESEPLAIYMASGENGRLFGAVTNQTIASALHAEGIEVERKRIELPNHTIKVVGDHPINVRLYEGEEARLMVQVRPESERPKKEGEEHSHEKKPAKLVAPPPEVKTTVRYDEDWEDEEESGPKGFDPGPEMGEVGTDEPEADGEDSGVDEE